MLKYIKILCIAEPLNWRNPITLGIIYCFIKTPTTVVGVYIVKKNGFKSYLYSSACLHIKKSKGTKKNAKVKYEYNGHDASLKLNVVQFAHNSGNNWITVGVA